MFSLNSKHKAPLRAVLETSLFSWPGHKRDAWTIGDATEGTQIFGSVGSGKSSGSGKKIAKAFLENGFGGLILCAKPDERAQWEAYARATGREKDLEVFEPNHGKFNPLIFELEREGGGETLNMVNLIMSLHELGFNFMSGGSSHGERFWDQTLRRSISRIIDLLKLCPSKKLSIREMRSILTSAPTTDEAKDYQDLMLLLKGSDVNAVKKDEIIHHLTQWAQESPCIEALLELELRKDLAACEIETQRLINSYFLKEFAQLAERTKSIVIESFLGLIEPFSSGILKKQFTTEVSPNLWPKNTFENGKIIILDFPIKEHLVAGIYAQAIVKHCWMQAIERRKLTDENVRPVFMWIDEAQFFINPEYDALFQTTARSSLCCSVYLTQNLNSYYFAMGEKSPEARAKSLLGNLNTKIFHANGDFDTNKYASDAIGKGFITMTALNQKMIDLGSSTLSQQLYYKVFPHEFTRLSKGGRKASKYTTEAIVFTAGSQWSTNENYLKVKFDQNA
jgi:hypothetical protein